MLAHLHLMKTAGQTMCNILRQSFPGRHCDLRTHGVATPADLRLARRVYTDLKSVAGHTLICSERLAGDCPDLRFFTFVRDPLQRCVSHYQFLLQKQLMRHSFQVWLTNMANYQTRVLAGTCDAERAIELIERHIEFVGVVERFNESLVLLRRWSPEPELNIHYRARNVARDNRVKRKLLADPRVVARILQHHEEDYKLYYYIRDVLYPRQVARYGPSLAADAAEFEASLPARYKVSIRRPLASGKRNFIYKPIAGYVMRRASKC